MKLTPTNRWKTICSQKILVLGQKDISKIFYRFKWFFLQTCYFLQFSKALKNFSKNPKVWSKGGILKNNPIYLQSTANLFEFAGGKTSRKESCSFASSYNWQVYLKTMGETAQFGATGMAQNINEETFLRITFALMTKFLVQPRFFKIIVAQGGKLLKRYDTICSRKNSNQVWAFFWKNGHSGVRNSKVFPNCYL